LAQRGIVLEPPEKLDAPALSTKLKELLQVLATMSFFITDTNHLSDRELYSWLFTDALREEVPDIERLGGAWHTSPIGGGDEEDTRIFLKYYATEEERRRWHEDFPDDAQPARELPPYDRDKHLPRAR
jgi:hypothetical protein